MAYQQMIRNEDGEPLGFETLYDDESFEGDYYDDFPDYGYDDDPPEDHDYSADEPENDLGDEWDS